MRRWLFAASLALLTFVVTAVPAFADPGVVGP